MKKLIPAVFFQKQLNGAQATPKRPEVLDLFESELRTLCESELRKVAGGTSLVMGARAPAKVTLNDPCFTTYSGSLGWLDVEQADDCAH